MNELFPDDRYKPPIHRTTDPATSRQGAEHIEPNLRTAQGRALFVWRRMAGTASEIGVEAVKQFGGNAETYRKRKAELYRAGLIRHIGTRRCMITGQTAEVYEGKPE